MSVHLNPGGPPFRSSYGQNTESIMVNVSEVISLERYEEDGEWKHVVLFKNGVARELDESRFNGLMQELGMIL